MACIRCRHTAIWNAPFRRPGGMASVPRPRMAGHGIGDKFGLPSNFFGCSGQDSWQMSVRDDSIVTNAFFGKINPDRATGINRRGASNRRNR